jgi:ribonucleoside-diphosphate reductase alpha chain
MNDPVINRVQSEHDTADQELEAQSISIDVLQEKYAKGDESRIDEVRERVAHGLAQAEDNPRYWGPVYYDAQHQGVVLAGRINSVTGTSIEATAINCFVQPVADSVSGVGDGKPGIYPALEQAAETMRRGGGEGYDFSAIRPRGATVRGTASRASGPVSYMRVFDRSCETVESAGARRGAQMGVLRVDHPDIMDFIEAKASGDLTNFNVSVGTTDAFMEAVQDERAFDLVHAAEPIDELKTQGAHQREDGFWVYDTMPAQRIWDAIMEHTYDHADPGVLFLDRINEENPLHYTETIEATNPYAMRPAGASRCGKTDPDRRGRPGAADTGQVSTRVFAA